ncbi:MAG: hypothetical protein EON59_02575 [Alphaproteobacteria bacterium]|nr:MAG: hypothetical protein EON59_02575 [Alphaproteobacteria bacterium]
MKIHTDALMSSRMSLALVALSLAGCDPAASDSGSNNSSNSAMSNAPAAVATSSFTAVATSSQQRVELTSDGILYRGGDAAAAQKVSFGDSEKEATGQLVTITSESTEYFPANAAGCSTTTFGETSAFFQNGAFAGYSTSDKDMKTAAGIGVGSTRAALEAAYDPEFMQMEQGGFDFTIPGMRGVVEGEGANEVIVQMAAGEICGR